MEDNEKIYMTAFDEKIQSRQTHLIKTLIPYISPRSQKFIATYVKFTELMDTVSFFNRQRSDVGICDLGQEKKNPLDLLMEIKRFSGESEQKNIDLAINMLNTMEMIKTYKDIMNQSENNDPMEFMKTMLTPEQQEMFNTYSNMNSSDSPDFNFGSDFNFGTEPPPEPDSESDPDLETEQDPVSDFSSDSNSDSDFDFNSGWHYNAPIDPGFTDNNT